jgi:multiple sugar transport system ATP-binding protein
MNFLDGVLNKDGNGFYFENDGDRHYIPAEKVCDGLADYIGKEVILGIRPEDIHDDEQSLAKPDNSIVDTSVEVRELMGSETYLYLEYKDKQIMARVPTGASSNSDGVLKVAFDMRKVHLFDVESERAIMN